MNRAFSRGSTTKQEAVDGRASALRFVPRRFGGRTGGDAGKAKQPPKPTRVESGGLASMLAGLVTAGAGLWTVFGRTKPAEDVAKDKARQRHGVPDRAWVTRRARELKHQRAADAERLTAERWNWRDITAAIQASPVARQASAVLITAPDRIIPLGREAARVVEHQVIPSSLGAARTAQAQVIPLGVLAAATARDRLAPIGELVVRTAQDELLPRGAEALRHAQHEWVPLGASAAKSAGEQVGHAAVLAGEAIRRNAPAVQAGLVTVGETAGEQVARLTKEGAKAARQAAKQARKAAKRNRRRRFARFTFGRANRGEMTMAPVGDAAAAVMAPVGKAGRTILSLPLLVLGAIWGLFWGLFKLAFQLAMLASLAGLIFYIYFPEPEQRAAVYDRLGRWWNRMTGAAILTAEPEEVAVDEAPIIEETTETQGAQIWRPNGGQTAS